MPRRCAFICMFRLPQCFCRVTMRLGCPRWAAGFRGCVLLSGRSCGLQGMHSDLCRCINLGCNSNYSALLCQVSMLAPAARYTNLVIALQGQMGDGSSEPSATPVKVSVLIVGAD